MKLKFLMGNTAYNVYGPAGDKIGEGLIPIHVIFKQKSIGYKPLKLYVGKRTRKKSNKAKYII